MKFLHVADLHLGATNKKISQAQKKMCKEEQIGIINALFSYAESQKVEVVLIAGDLFHSSSIPAKMVNSFFERVKEFLKPVIYVRGNHDEEFFFQNLPENFIILAENQTLDFNTFTISTGLKDLKILDAQKKNIIILHGDIYTLGNDYININLLKDKNVDYLALGHLHTFQEQDFERGKLCYSGSLFGSGFDECGEKGFVIVEIDDKVKLNFVTTKARQYHIVDVDITGITKFDKIKERIREKLNSISKNDFIRVILTGYFEENTEKYVNLLETAFSDFFYLEIQDKTKFKIDIERYKGEELSFKAELLKLINEQNLSEEEKNLMSQISIEALRGDDLSI